MAQQIEKLDSDSSSLLRCDLQLVGSQTEFAAVKSEWLAFLQRPTVSAGFFTDPSVIELNVSFDKGDRIIIGRILAADDLVAIVPLINSKRPIVVKFGLVRIFCLSLFRARIADFDFPREVCVKADDAFAMVVDACSNRVRELDLVTVDSVMVPEWGERRKEFRIKGIQDAYTVEIKGRFEDYLLRISPKSRQTIKRKIRKFHDEAGASVRVVAFRQSEQMGDLHSALERVWGKSWHARVGRQNVPSLAYLRTLAARQWVRAYVLFVGDDPVASILGFQYANTYYYEAPAYNQDWQERSPGIVLLYHLIKDLFEVDSPMLCDFGFGYGQYKQVFGTHVRRCGSICAAITLRGRFIVGFQSMSDFMFILAKNCLTKTGIPRLVKKRIRGAA